MNLEEQCNKIHVPFNNVSVDEQAYEWMIAYETSHKSHDFSSGQ